MAGTLRLANMLVKEREYEKGAVSALKLQAQAWRLLAIVATHDPSYAKGQIRILLFNTVPFINEPIVRRLIEQHQLMAEDFGLRSGVFDCGQADRAGA